MDALIWQEFEFVTIFSILNKNYDLCRANSVLSVFRSQHIPVFCHLKEVHTGWPLRYEETYSYLKIPSDYPSLLQAWFDIYIKTNINDIFSAGSGN